MPVGFPDPAAACPAAPVRSAKRRVVEVEAEPPHRSVPDAAPRSLELLVSATCDFARAECSTAAVHFRDTLMLQTRVYE